MGWLRFVATCLTLHSFVDLGLFVSDNTLWRADGGLTLLALFGLMFFTKRILDCYPVATLSFFCIAMALTGEWRAVRMKVSALTSLATAAREPTT